MNMSTNGIGHAQASAPSFVDYPLRSATAVEPGKTVSIPHRLRRNATIIDVMSSPETVIENAALNRRRIDLSEDKRSLHEILLVEPCEAPGGAFCVFKVRNSSDVSTVLDIIVRVTNEHGPEVESPSPFRMSNASASTASEPRKAPAPKTRKPEPSQQVRISNKASSKTTKGGGVRRPPPGMSDKERAKERAKRAQVRSRMDEAGVITVTPLVQPDAGSKVITIFRAHASALQSFFATRARMRPQLRPMLMNALAKANARVVGDATKVPAGEIAILLPEADVAALYKAIRLHQEYQLPAVQAASIKLAIQKALAGAPSDPVITAPAQQLAADVTESSDDSSEIKEADAMLAEDLSNPSTPVDGRSE